MTGFMQDLRYAARALKRAPSYAAISIVTLALGIGATTIVYSVVDGILLINEVAPRPHNSGHYTLDACSLSQFEQQVRAVCGLAPEEVRLLSPAAMVNLIGRDIETIKQDPECERLLQLPGTVVHDYGKREIRPRRKMGHVTFLAQDRRLACERAEQLRQRLLFAHRQ